MKRPFGTPVAFGSCAGFVHDGGGSVGVILLPAWGFEEFTIRRGWAELADRLAADGYCALRFDWPGTGDSLGDTAAGTTLADWFEAARQAAHFLRDTKGIARLILIGHGIGGLLAPHLSAALGADVTVLMAPQNEGRMGWRELSISSRMIASFLRIPTEPGDGGIEVAGFSLAKALADEISALSLADCSLAAGHPVLALSRGGAEAGAHLKARLDAAGADVTLADYTGYQRFLAYDMTAETPHADFETVLAFLKDRLPSVARETEGADQTGARLVQPGAFQEQPLLFGPENRLFGIVCQPEGKPSRGVIVLVNSGYNYHAGWARMHVEFARALAQKGISSLRIDTSGIGDSPLIHDRPPFYDQAQVEDVIAAVTAAENLGLGPVLVSGRCSGAYSSLQAAVSDSRIRGVIAVNPARLAIGPSESFEQVMAAGTSSMADYRRRAFSPSMLKDIATGKMPLGKVLAKATSIAGKQAKALLAKVSGSALGLDQVNRMAKEQAETLLARGVKPRLIYAENDGGLDELARFFGRLEPQAYRHAAVRVVAGAEHNMTARHARQAILNEMVAAVDAL